MKDLFFEEKDVKIVEVQKQPVKEQSKRDKKTRSGKKELKSKPLKSVNVENPPLPEQDIDQDILFMNPFYNFEDVLSGQVQDDSSKTSPPPGRITFLDPLYNPLFVQDLTASRNYSHGLAQKPNDHR